MRDIDGAGRAVQDAGGHGFEGSCAAGPIGPLLRDEIGMEPPCRHGLGWQPEAPSGRCQAEALPTAPDRVPLLSHRCTYALRLSLFLATQERGGFVPVHDIGEALGMPKPFLSKAAQALTRASVLQTRRGPHGGVALARSSRAIRLIEIVLAVDGADAFQTCVLGLPECGAAQPCPLHDVWTGVRAQARDMFADATLADLAEGTFRLASPRLDPSP